ncbi:MAG: DUF5615 family PIN-like protein [bacterium]
MKKHSAAQSTSKPPDAFRLVLDETLAGKSILEGLQQQGIPAIPLTEFVPRGATDEAVLEALAQKGDLYFITRDHHFRYHPGVKERLLAGGVGAFVITSAGNKTAAQIVELLLAAWPHINKFVSTHQRPFAAKVAASGKIELHS